MADVDRSRDRLRAADHRAVGACHVLIVVMGPRWATIEDEDGGVRIAEPGDFVRLEVGTALRRSDVTVIPVLVSGADAGSRRPPPTSRRSPGETR
jgi:hypothetical protein